MNKRGRFFFIHFGEMDYGGFGMCGLAFWGWCLGWIFGMCGLDFWGWGCWAFLAFSDDLVRMPVGIYVL